MKKIYIQPELLLETAQMSDMVMLETSDYPADPSQPVLGKDRDEFDEIDEEILDILQEQEGEQKSLW